MTLAVSLAGIASNATSFNTVSLTSGTAVASTSGTSIDFTGIPSGVKRITIMFSGVSTNGSSNIQIQIGAGSITNTGYTSVALYCQQGIAPTVTNSTTGFLVTPVSGLAEVISGTVVFTWLSANIWTCFGSVCDTASTNNVDVCSGSLSLGGTLDRVRITTVNGTDTFDAGTINILYE